MNGENKGILEFDKKVPIAVVLVIILQTFGGVWWASSVSERLEQLELQVQITPMQESRIVRNETRIEFMGATLLRIEEKLDRLIDKNKGP